MPNDGLKLTARIVATEGGWSTIRLADEDDKYQIGTARIRKPYAGRILAMLATEHPQQPAEGPPEAAGQPISPKPGDSTPETETSDEQK